MGTCVPGFPSAPSAPAGPGKPCNGSTTNTHMQTVHLAGVLLYQRLHLNTTLMSSSPVQLIKVETDRQQKYVAANRLS